MIAKNYHIFYRFKKSLCIKKSNKKLNKFEGKMLFK